VHVWTTTARVATTPLHIADTGSLKSLMEVKNPKDIL
jgi:hypothetical protein